MTVTRLWETGFELANNSYDAGPNVTFTGVMSYSTITVRTGTYSLQMETGISRLDFYYDTTTPIAQARINCQFYYGGGVGGLGEPELFYFRSNLDFLHRIKYTIADGTWLIWYGNGTDVLTSTVHALTVGWHQLCVDIKIDTASGWISLYDDGVEFLSYTGQTDQGGSSFNDLGIGPVTGTRRWGTTEFVDDVTMDDTTGEPAPANSEDRRYHLMVPDGAGNYSDWTPSAGSNWENVDEIPPDGDTSYNESNVDEAKDSYSVADYAVPSGRKVDALIAIGGIRKVSALDTVQAVPFLRQDGIDNKSSAQDIESTYETYRHRITTAPGGGVIYQSVVDEVEAGVEVAVP